MSTSTLTEVQYQFEECPPLRRSRFALWAATACHLARTRPLDLPLHPAGDSSQAASALSDSSPCGSDVQAVRLRAISMGQRVLLDRSYDVHGRLERIRHSDGREVRYAWDAMGRLRTADLGEGRRITFTIDADGLLRAIEYPGSRRFLYEHDGDGRLTCCVDPDGRSVSRRYDRLGRLCAVSSPGLELTCAWSPLGVPATLTAKAAHLIQKVEAMRSRLTLRCESVSAGAGLTVTSVLGRWELDPAGMVSSLVLPDGHWLALLPPRRTAAGVEQAIWSPCGEERFEIEAQGRLKRIVHPDGARTVLDRLPGTDWWCAVRVNGVDLHRHDKHGRLDRIRTDDGRYALYQHDRRGRIASVETESEHTTFRRDKAGRLSHLRFASGLAAEVRYGPRGPQELQLTGVGGNLVAAACQVGRALWQAAFLSRIEALWATPTAQARAPRGGAPQEP